MEEGEKSGYLFLLLFHDLAWFRLHLYPFVTSTSLKQPLCMVLTLSQALVTFFFFWLCWAFVATCRLSLVAVSRCYSSYRARSSLCNGFSCCKAQALACARDSVDVVNRFSCPVAYRIFQTRDWTHVPCIGRQILNQWTPREALVAPSSLQVVMASQVAGPWVPWHPCYFLEPWPPL